MDFKKLADQAKSAIDKRGGTESLKEDFGELKDIAKGDGSLADKAKEAVAAVKDPGDAGPDAAASPAPAPSPEPSQAKEPVPDPQAPGAEHHGKRHGHGQGRHRRDAE